MSDNTVYFDVKYRSPAATFCKPFEDKLKAINAGLQELTEVLKREFKIKKAGQIEIYHGSGYSVAGFRLKDGTTQAIKQYSEKYPRTFRYKHSTRNNPGFATWYANAQGDCNKAVLQEIRDIIKKIPQADAAELWPLIGQPANQFIWLGMSMITGPGYHFNGKRITAVLAGVNHLTDQETGKPTKLMEGVTPSLKVNDVNSERRYKEVKRIIRRKLKEKNEKALTTAGGRSDDEDLFA